MAESHVVEVSLAAIDTSLLFEIKGSSWFALMGQALKNRPYSASIVCFQIYDMYNVVNPFVRTSQKTKEILPGQRKKSYR